MAGEMYAITQDGVSSDGERWPLHAAIARAVGGVLKPFDRYQGPYIVVGRDVVVGHVPYRIPVMHAGVKRLWIYSDRMGMARIYREDTDTTSEPFEWDDEETAVSFAKKILEEKNENSAHG